MNELIEACHLVNGYLKAYRIYAQEKGLWNNIDEVFFNKFQVAINERTAEE